MADPDPNTPQVIDPERVVDLTRLLQIRGPLGVLNVLDTIVPVVNMGDVVTRTVTVLQPAFRSTDVFSAGEQNGAPLNTVHADTGALPEGTYDIFLDVSPVITDSLRWKIQHRNADNTANLAEWSHLVVSGSGAPYQQGLGYEVSINERLRILNGGALLVGVFSLATIFARRRA